MSTLFKIHAAVIDKRIHHDPGSIVETGCRKQVELKNQFVIDGKDIGRFPVCFDCLKLYGKTHDENDELILFLGPLGMPKERY